MERKAANPSAGLKLVGEALLREQNRRFQTQTDPDGRPWQPLAPLTVLTRGGATGPILRRSGQLMRSGAWQVSGATLRIGLNTIYAGVQHFGATIVPKNARRLAIPVPGGKPPVVMAGKVTIPARPIVGFGAKDEEAARGAIEGWLAVEGGG
ncbi:MAG: phage virion morphogenesis protein [Rhodoblastus sp.]|nr:MAG: phage virion morphogenesis protein [Rhodoblastus sp.]